MMSREVETYTTVAKAMEMIKAGEFTHSIIETNEIKKKGERGLVVSTSTNFHAINKDLWGEMPTQKIVQNTTYNMNLTQKRSYKLCSASSMYIQYKNANGAFSEIINMVMVNNFNIEIYIKLKSGRNVCFKL